MIIMIIDTIIIIVTMITFAVILTRFGQRCGEAKVTVHANAEVSLVDQIKELNLHIKQLEKQIHVLEDEKSAVNLELQTSKDYWKAVWEPRALTSVEKVNCKLCVQNLFASAKESLSLSLSNSNQSDDGPSPPKNQILNTNKNQRIIDSNEKLPKNHDNVDNNDLAIPITPATISVSSEVDSLIERSQEDLYLAVEKMDRAVLIELSIALGGLMQTMFLEREKAKAEEQKRIQRKTRIMADKESRLKARMELEAAEKVIYIVDLFHTLYISAFIYTFFSSVLCLCSLSYQILFYLFYNFFLKYIFSLTIF